MIAASLVHSAVLFCVAVVAGAVNSVAGGGTLLTFPTLMWAGLPAKAANATNTLALWPGSLAGLWGYREDIRDSRIWMLRFGAVSVAGGLAGAVLLLHTPPQVFEALVPYLILLATLLFATQDPLNRWLRARRERAGTATQAGHGWMAGLAFQFAVAIYGGYFGAGIGILMLAALSLMSFEDIHQMNGLKNFAALCINGTASVAFIVGGAVRGRAALLMASGAIVGGYCGAGAARRLGQKAVRRIIVGIGVVITISMFLHRV